MGMKEMVGRQLAPRIHDLAPGLTTGFVREALNRAVDGVGPLPPAAVAADKQLAEQGGNVDRAIHEVIENNVRIAGAQGFVTNLGGLVTMAVAVPANITGLAIIQCRMVAGIAHLRGHDLADPRVRNAILAMLLGEEQVSDLVRKRKLPAPCSSPWRCSISARWRAPSTSRAVIASSAGGSSSAAATASGSVNGVGS